MALWPSPNSAEKKCEMGVVVVHWVLIFEVQGMSFGGPFKEEKKKKLGGGWFESSGVVVGPICDGPPAQVTWIIVQSVIC